MPLGVTRFDVRLVKSLAGKAAIDISKAGLGTIKLKGNGEIAADVNFHLVFGVDSNGFFVEPLAAGQNEFTLSNIQINGEAEGEGRIGFLGIEAHEITINFAAAVGVAIEFSDPGTGKLIWT